MKLISRSVVTGGMGLCAGILALGVCMETTSAADGPAVAGASPFAVEHIVLAQLGTEHLANATYRHGADGDSLVAWGDRVLEWPLAAPHNLREAMPRDKELEYSNGGCAMDVDGDGKDEIVVARGRGISLQKPDLVWLREVPGQPSWELHLIGKLDVGSGGAPHDIHPFAAKLPSGRTVRGAVAILSRQELVWYEVPPDPTAPWIRHDIGMLPGQSQSGMAVGDLAGHGRPDVVCGMFWAECPADPTREAWIIRRFGNWQDGGWGGMAQLALGDIDGDGKLEIVASEAEIPNSRLGVFKRDPSQPDGLWQCHEIERGLYCPHSLAVADLDGDGQLDLVVGEMTAGGWDFPLNPKPRLLAYLNRGSFHFERATLVEGWGVHEMSVAPRPYQGRLLLYASDEIQRRKLQGQMKTHVSLWAIRFTP